MEYSIFAKLSSSEIKAIYEMLETALPEVDLDIINDVLYIYTGKGDYVINQHSPTNQIWLSSPVSNAGYFNYDINSKNWLDKNSISLRKRIADDLGIDYP